MNDTAVANRWRYAWLWAAIWLVYLAPAIGGAWHNPDPVGRIVGTASTTLFALLYCMAFAMARIVRRQGRQMSLPTLIAIGGGAVLLATVMIVSVGRHALGVLVYLAVMAVFLLPAVASAIAVGVLLIVSLAVPATVHGWAGDLGGLTFQVFVAAVAMWGVVQLVQRNAQLAAAREEITRLAVLNERHRFARDLHDILGHSLTVVAVKAELAGRLVRLAPDRAEREIGEVEQLARDALADVRAAVNGYREVTVDEELASARTALAAAGISADVPGDGAVVPPDRAELFGWAIREGVTNVVRHSGARRCRIQLSPHEVEITDDGRGPDGAGTDRSERGVAGHGLAGLRERAGEIGGEVTVGRSVDGGFLLRLRVP
ncbi:MAG TPA: sensor histidine kinase [Micromonosporaceae bacterium]